MPETLTGVYTRIFSCIELRYFQNTRKALRWVAFGFRPLRIKEVAEIFVVDCDASARIDFTRRIFDPETLLSKFAGLIVMQETEEDAKSQHITNIVRLAHHSVREYLVCESILEGPARDYGMQEPDAHAQIANECIAYLLQFDQMETITVDLLEEFPLAHYPSIRSR